MTIENRLKDPDKKTLEQKCRNDGFEFVKDQNVYCGCELIEGNEDTYCIYRSDNPSKNKLYRCMNLDKGNLWKYEKG